MLLIHSCFCGSTPILYASPLCACLSDLLCHCAFGRKVLTLPHTPFATTCCLYDGLLTFGQFIKSKTFFEEERSVDIHYSYFYLSAFAWHAQHTNLWTLFFSSVWTVIHNISFQLSFCWASFFSSFFSCLSDRLGPFTSLSQYSYM